MLPELKISDHHLEYQKELLNRNAERLFIEAILALGCNPGFRYALSSEFFDHPDSVATPLNPLVFADKNARYEMTLIRTEDEDELSLFKYSIPQNPAGVGQLIHISLTYKLNDEGRKLDSSQLSYDRIRGRCFSQPVSHEVNTVAACGMIMQFISRLY